MTCVFADLLRDTSLKERRGKEELGIAIRIGLTAQKLIASNRYHNLLDGEVKALSRYAVLYTTGPLSLLLVPDMSKYT